MSWPLSRLSASFLVPCPEPCYFFISQSLSRPLDPYGPAVYFLAPHWAALYSLAPHWAAGHLWSHHICWASLSGSCPSWWAFGPTHSWPITGPLDPHDLSLPWALQELLDCCGPDFPWPTAFMLGCSPLAFPLYGITHKAVGAEAFWCSILASPWSDPCVTFHAGCPTTGSPTTPPVGCSRTTGSTTLPPVGCSFRPYLGSVSKLSWSSLPLCGLPLDTPYSSWTARHWDPWP